MSTNGRYRTAFEHGKQSSADFACSGELYSVTRYHLYEKRIAPIPRNGRGKCRKGSFTA